MLKISPSFVLIIVGVYLPFDSYVLYVSGAGDTLAMILKLGSELLLYALFMLAIMAHLYQSKIKLSPIDSYVLALIAVSIFSVFLYSADWFTAINNMRALLRYLVVFYLVYYFGFSMRSWKTLTKLMVVVIALNVLFSILQFGMGDSYPDILKVIEKVRVSLDEDTEVQHIIKQEKIGAVQGLQEAPGVLGAFLVVSMVILLARVNDTKLKRRWPIILLIILSIITSYLTFSKTSLLFTMLTVLIFYYNFNLRLRYLIIVTIVISFMLAILTFVGVSSSVKRTIAKKEEVSATQNLANLFSSQYWDHFFSAERGWVIAEVAPELITSLPIVGYSPDPVTVRKKIVESSDGRLSRLIEFTPMEDVYWVALLGYYGFLGMFFLVMIFVILYQRAVALLDYARRHGDRDLMAFSSTFLAMLFVMIPYNFIERVLVFNIFSFYFWLMAGGVVWMYENLPLPTIHDNDESPEYIS